MGKSWLQVWIIFLIGFGCQSQIIDTVQAGDPVHAMTWDPLPNGLMSIAYDRTEDGIPDYFTLHTITWSGWSAQEIEEIERQARMDEQWVFMVEYDQDRYVYFVQPTPVLVGDDLKQTGKWMARKVRPTDVKVSQHFSPTDPKAAYGICPIGDSRQHQKPCS